MSQLILKIKNDKKLYRSSGEIAVTESVDVQLVNIGSSSPGDLVLQIFSHGVEVANCLSFTANGTVVSGTMNLDTEELVAIMEKYVSRTGKKFEITLRDAVLNKVLISDAIYIISDPSLISSSNATALVRRYIENSSITVTGGSIPAFSTTQGLTIAATLATIDANGSISIPLNEKYKINGVAITYTDVDATPATHLTDANPHNITVGLIGAEPANANIQAHISATNNPHATTKAQLGLGNVANVDTTNASNISSGTLSGDRLPSDTSKRWSVPPVTSATGKVLSDLGTWVEAGVGGGSGSVVNVSVVTANGVSGSVANPTTAPAITLALGAITPSSVNGVVLSGTSTPTLAVTGTTTVSGANTGDETESTIKTKLGITTLSGSNTGDQTDITGNAGTVTNGVYVTGNQTIGGTKTFSSTIAGSINGNAATVTNATLTTALTVNTGTVTLKGNAANTSELTIGAGAVSVSGANTGDQTTITGNAGTATALATPRNINGVAFDGTANITINAVDSTARIASSLKGAANGVAELDANSLVPLAQLPTGAAGKLVLTDENNLIPSALIPGGVDTITEVADFASLPGTGTTGVIYLTLDNGAQYRWGGTTYAAMTAGVVPNAPITGATKTKITYDAKGLVTAGADATTADIADSTDKRYCTDAEKTVIGNTSGTNTGDQTLPVKATGAEITSGVDDDKFATAKALSDAGIIAHTKASGAEITTGTDDAKYATAKAIKDAGIVATPVKASAAEIIAGTDDAKFATAKAIKDANIGASVLTLTANADGFSIAGGTTSRQLDVSGGNVGLVGGGISRYFVPLAVDIANSTVTIANCTGLSATLESGKTYLFKFRVRYTTAVYTTGIFLSVNGPAFTAGTLSINTLLPLANTTNMAPSHLGAYDAGVVSTGAGTGAGDNGRVFYTEVDGTVKTTASGDLILRFRSEVAGSAVTIKAGSLLELVKVD